jgi:phenylalanyl-tRNA synthetase alpha chain
MEIPMTKIDTSLYEKSILDSANLSDLEKIHVELFSKSGFFAKAMYNMASLSVDEKKILGQELNSQKNHLSEVFFKKQEELVINGIKQNMLDEKLDLTQPLSNVNVGLLHPLTYSVEEMVNIFASMGFSLKNANDIEEDWYNFTALNVPLSHPARQEHDTFYLNMLDNQGLKKVLRTHTSNVQIRTMMEHTKNKTQPLVLNEPIKIIAPGRTYRSDSDATHSPMFHQMEGLYIDKIENISLAQLKGVLENFCEQYFGLSNLPLRFRSSYFPFTSPSFEVDIQCDRSSANLKIGEGNDWLEVLGCGIVHSNVLENCGIDSKIYGGFAFGLGLERFTMLKYGFRDLRAFYNGDIRWLKHYGLNSAIVPTLTKEYK